MFSILITLGATLAVVALLLGGLHLFGAQRVEALFRHPPKTPKPPRPDHYYKPYWRQ
ncbi:MAG TPA: hypothetical protein VJU18_11875 [Vicinamibacteria bacterium]|nr:hypothetical protein [Vicinamibacteria bacterium]